MRFHTSCVKNKEVLHEKTSRRLMLDYINPLPGAYSPEAGSHVELLLHSCIFARKVTSDSYRVFVIWRNIHQLTEVGATNRNPTPVSTVSIPYVKGTSETISWILQPYNILVTHKPTTTYWPMLMTETNPTTDREQFTRSNALTARVVMSVRLAETWMQGWLNTNELREMVMPTKA